MANENKPQAPAQAAQPSKAEYPFGIPAFGVPARRYNSRDGKSTMTCQVRLPLLGAPGLSLQASIWAREQKAADDGTIEVHYGVALPRDLHAADNDQSAAAIVRRVQNEVLTGYDKWLDTAGAEAQKPFDDTPKLVRKVAPAAAAASK
jgi:hypothetical protein